MIFNIRMFIVCMLACMVALAVLGCAKKPPHVPVSDFQTCIDQRGGDEAAFLHCDKYY